MAFWDDFLNEDVKEPEIIPEKEKLPAIKKEKKPLKKAKKRY